MISSEETHRSNIAVARHLLKMPRSSTDPSTAPLLPPLLLACCSCCCLRDSVSAACSCGAARVRLLLLLLLLLLLPRPTHDRFMRCSTPATKLEFFTRERVLSIASCPVSDESYFCGMGELFFTLF